MLKQRCFSWKSAALPTALPAVLLFSALGSAAGAQAWIAPTPEELAMTSQPGAPGAPAVFLYKEQTTDDSLRMFSFYVRLKVLTDAGKEYANVELPYLTGETGASVDSIAGRTIHPDGTIIPFSGKPYEKLVVKGQGFKEMAKVFTLPAVEPGSIIEYRYKLHRDNVVVSPSWYVQSELYTRKAHYMWRPSNRLVYSMGDREQVNDRIAWMPLLPAGAEVKRSEVRGRQAGGNSEGGIQFDLDVHDIPPLVREKLMAPPDSLYYRVMFYYTSYNTMDDFWKGEGKYWSKQKDKFIGPGSGVKSFVEKTVSPSDTPDQKLHKLYDFVMSMDNTSFSREHTGAEERSQGLRQVNNTDDVLARKRGNDDQLADLFVAMARAAGFKAYVMQVSNRREELFIPQFQSLRQLDDDLAIVEVDGKERYFDPGQRGCEYGQLAWVHAGTGGLLQTDNGAQIAYTPEMPYKAEHVIRTADLLLDEHGQASGTVSMQLTGDPALRWRQASFRGDETSLKAELKHNLENMLPGGMEVHVVDIKNVEDSSKPLSINYRVSGPVATSTGKRLLVPAYLFAVNEKPLFPDPHREQAVMMEHGTFLQEAVRYTLPANMVVESAPKPDKLTLASSAAYSTDAKPVPNKITLFRNVQVAKSVYAVKDYPDLRGFYTQMDAKDHDPLVLTMAGPASADAGKSASSRPGGQQ